MTSKTLETFRVNPLVYIKVEGHVTPVKDEYSSYDLSIVETGTFITNIKTRPSRLDCIKAYDNWQAEHYRQLVEKETTAVCG